MAEDGNRGPNESFRRTQGGRKRREAPFIDATATEVSQTESGEPNPVEAVSGTESSEAAAISAQDTSPRPQGEPVLFGSPVRDGSLGRKPPPPAAGVDPAPADEPSSQPDIAAEQAGFEPSAGADPLAPDPGSTARTPRVRRSAAPILLGLLVLALLASTAGLFFWARNRSAELSASITGLQGRLAALEARPDPAAAESRIQTLDQRTAATSGEIAPLKKAVDDLNARLVDLAAKTDASQAKLSALQQPASPEPSSTVSPAEMAALSGKVDELSSSLERLQNRPEPAPPPPQAPVDLGPIEGRIARLDSREADFDGRLKALSGTVAALPRPDLGPLQAEVTALGHRLDSMQATLSAQKSSERVTEVRAVGSADETRAAPLAVVAEALNQAIAQGRPFGSEVEALRSLGVEDATVAPLASLAAKGAPTLEALRNGWAGLANETLAATRPKGAGSVFDRFAAGARGLVQVRRDSAGPAEDSGSIVNRVGVALDRGDLAGALAEWEKLPEAARRVSKDWADAVRARLEAEGAAQALMSRAISTLAKDKG